VCGGLLRHDVQQKHEPATFRHYTTVRAEEPATAERPVRQPVGV
jgi:hypothetical protein